MPNEKQTFTGIYKKDLIAYNIYYIYYPINPHIG